jgi:hypothetical protein
MISSNDKVEFLKANFYHFALLSFLIFYLVEVIHYQQSFAFHPWITGDWLINYSNGFIRRGFLGAVIDKYGDVFNRPLSSLVLEIKIMFYLIWVGVFYCLAIKKSIGFIEFILILSPWAFLFDLHDPQGSGRKELVLLCIFSIYIYFIVIYPPFKKNLFHNWAFYFLLLTLPTLTIIHEGLFFYLQFFLLPLIFNKKYSHALLGFFISYLAAAFTATLMYLFFKGDITYANSICTSLLNKGFQASICRGAIDAINPTGVYFDSLYYQIYVPIFFLTLAPLALYFYKVSHLSGAQKIYLILIGLIPTVPLYLISFDWGRWIHIYGLLSLILFMGIKTHKLQLNLGSVIALLPIGFFYILCWIIPHSIVGLKEFRWFQIPSFSFKELRFYDLWMFINF